MINTSFVFVGNRRFVLEEMIKVGLYISKVFIAKGTHLEHDFNNGVLPNFLIYEIIKSKIELENHLFDTEFDVLVSNGCPYILSISELPKARYVNIHPSLLPDLRGYDPVIGAVLYERDTGATCHVMDNNIDTGEIISQVHIPYTEDLDVTTLYQLSFIAEQRAFNEAYLRDFEPLRPQNETYEIIQYKRKKIDYYINFHESIDTIIQKIKAFNNISQGCRFIVNGVEYKVFGIERMKNPFLVGIVFNKQEGEIVFSYEGCVIFHKDSEVLRLIGVKSLKDEVPLKVGTNLLRG